MRAMRRTRCIRVGRNGSARGLIDSRALADALARERHPEQALRAYETERAEQAARVVRTNPEAPPGFINIKVEELTGDQPFDRLDRFISQNELRALSDQYKLIAGFRPSDLQ